MQLGLGGAVRQRMTTRKLPMYSKQWSPGDTLRTFYRVFKAEDTGMWNILSGMCWGYPVSDIKGLGLQTSFIPALCQFDEDGRPIGKPDILYRFSRLAPLFVKGQHEADIQNIMQKKGLSNAQQVEAIRKIDEKYDTKNNIQAIRPIIGRATPLIVIEVVAVPFKDGVPNYESLFVCMHPISDSQANNIIQLLSDPVFAPGEDEDYFEVEWVYPMASKKAESGLKVKPAGVKPELKLKNQFSDAFKDVQQAMSAMSTDSEMIKRRSTSAVSEGRIMSALATYVSLNSEHLDECSLNDELLASLEDTIGVIHELKMDNVVADPKVREILDRANSVIANPDTSNLPTPSAGTAAMPANQPVADMSAVMGNTELNGASAIDQSVPDISALIGAGVDTMKGEEFFQNIDLGAMGDNM